MVELIRGERYKITSLNEYDGWIEKFKHNSLPESVVFDRISGGCAIFKDSNKEYYHVREGLKVKELPPPKAEAYTMPEIHEAAGFGIETKMFNIPHNGHLTLQTEVPRETSRQFESGAVRDSNAGKPRPDLISPYFLESLGNVLAKGAIKYGDRNWEKGMPQETFKESAARHYVSWMMNKEDEDHATNLAFNLMAWIHFRDKK